LTGKQPLTQDSAVQADLASWELLRWMKISLNIQVDTRVTDREELVGTDIKERNKEYETKTN